MKLDTMAIMLEQILTIVKDSPPPEQQMQVIGGAKLGFTSVENVMDFEAKIKEDRVLYKAVVRF